ncbi:hypothetical protein FHU33_3843 [Blastococcus colisei]|uniref:DUF998 domain-containing protein n=1 Tax=Blastococcus colisei TaxID=1564162 RepID=A0A543PJV2_9ACTN|nr:hypothetical protein [Blastococcus colisei]TQN44342.1 hypothetical protein FHU33_3843 [Blastococcus colisei]
MTTMTTMTTTTESITSRRARTGMLGGALWALMPLAFGAAEMIGDDETGTLGAVAVAASDWIFLVLPPALILVGLDALRRALGSDAGRVGSVGMALTAVGLAAMAVGNGIEVASLTTGGGEVPVGHAMFLIGFLVSVVGSLLLGIVVLRRRRDRLARAAGLVLALALPLGIAIGMLGSTVGSENDAWFFASISVPTGIAWVLLGRSLAQVRRIADREPVTAS